jgi:hypothetical protein
VPIRTAASSSPTRRFERPRSCTWPSSRPWCTVRAFACACRLPAAPLTRAARVRRADCMGGLEISPHAQVLRAGTTAGKVSAQVIPGLFAAGEARRIAPRGLLNRRPTLTLNRCIAGGGRHPWAQPAGRQQPAGLRGVWARGGQLGVALSLRSLQAARAAAQLGRVDAAAVRREAAPARRVRGGDLQGGGQAAGQQRCGLRGRGARACACDA